MYKPRSLEGEKRRVAALPRGNNHKNYSSNPSVRALHMRLRRKYGSAKMHSCADCGEQAYDWSLESKEYTDNIADYKPRCRSCHIYYDDINRNRQVKIRETKIQNRHLKEKKVG